MLKIQLRIMLLMAVLMFACRKDPDLHPKDNSTTQNPTTSSTTSTTGGKTIGTPYKLVFPQYFGQPNIPADNPMTVEGVKLGRYLFYDSTLSKDNTISCASCHHQSHAFSDAPNAVSLGIKADGYPKGTFNAMPLFNLAWSRKVFFWNGRIQGDLEDQILQPVQNPVEMHLDTTTMLSRLNTRADYKQMFKNAFGDKPITGKMVAKAVAQFVRSIVSAGSRYDGYNQGGIALTALEKQGMTLVLTDPLDYQDTRKAWHRQKFSGINCFHCHSPGLFTPEPSLSVMEDNGFAGRKFKTPSLRNLAYTAPYMQDGSLPNLDSVLAHYNRLQPESSTDPIFPNTVQHPYLMELSPDEAVAVKAFLNTLNDSTLLTNPAYSNPFHK